VPILENTRHEKFAQELAAGKSATESYVLAGFKPSRKNTSRLRAREDVSARINELQGLAARSAVITVATICAELDDAIVVAKAKGQAQAMVSASALRAKLAGLGVERVEVTASITDAYEECRSPEEIFATLARQWSKDHELTSEEVEGFVKLLMKSFAAFDEYVAGCKAKVVQPMISVEDRERHERRRLGLPSRALNGSGR
jgi:hypothetical protein